MFNSRNIWIVFKIVVFNYYLSKSKENIEMLYCNVIIYVFKTGVITI